MFRMPSPKLAREAGPNNYRKSDFGISLCLMAQNAEYLRWENLSETSVHQPILERVPDELRRGKKLELPQYVIAMGADGFHTQVEFGGDFLDAFASRNQQQHFVFTIGEILMKHSFGAALKMASQLPCERGSNVVAAA